MKHTHLSLVDRLICDIDRSLRTLTPNTKPAISISPAEKIENTTPLSTAEQKHSAGLMRVNHAGEVCAQALYQGQALTAKLPEVRKEMEVAADEEIDHLAWCESRLTQLNSHTSVLNPLWYSLSFGIGATAGLVSDKVSLGFVAATEEQVCKHLRSHLDQLPKHDGKSRAIVNQMLEDEEKHAKTALDAGGAKFPPPIKQVMSWVSLAMTKTSYHI